MNTNTSNLVFFNETISDTTKDKFLQALIEKRKDLFQVLLCDNSRFFGSKSKLETIEFLIDETKFPLSNCTFYEIDEGLTYANGFVRKVIIIELIHENKIFDRFVNFLFKRSLIIQKQTFFAFEIGSKSGKINYLNLTTRYFRNEQLEILIKNN